MYTTRTGADRSSASRSSAGRSSTSRSHSGLNSWDEGTREVATAADLRLQPYGNQQPQTPQAHYYQYSNDGQGQGSQKTKWKLRMCGNNLDESIMSIANGWRDSGHDCDVDIDCSENVGKKSTFMAFNCNDGESNITLGHGWRDLDRDFDIDCSGKVGKNSTFKGFNYGEEG